MVVGEVPADAPQRKSSLVSSLPSPFSLLDAAGVAAGREGDPTLVLLARIARQNFFCGNTAGMSENQKKIIRNIRKS